MRRKSYNNSDYNKISQANKICLLVSTTEDKTCIGYEAEGISNLKSRIGGMTKWLLEGNFCFVYVKHASCNRILEV